MKNGKRQIAEDIKLLNQKRIRTLGEKKNFKYLGMQVLEADTIKQAEMTEKIRKETRTSSKKAKKY